MWPATDIALVVSTTATAATSFGAVLLPFIRDKQAARRKANEERHASLAKSIQDCAMIIDEVTEFDRELRMQVAFSEAGSYVSAATQERSIAINRFYGSINMVRLLAAEIGVDPQKFVRTAREVRGLGPRYEVIDGELQQTNDGIESLREQGAMRDRMVELGAALLDEAAHKLSLR